MGRRVAEPSIHSADRFVQRIDCTVNWAQAIFILRDLYAKSKFIPPELWLGDAEWSPDTAYRYAVYRRGRLHRGVALIVKDHTIITVKAVRRWGDKFRSDHAPAYGMYRRTGT